MRSRGPVPRRPPRPPDPPFTKVLADLSVGLGAVTALMYYFGWVMTRSMARALGFDVSALRLETADYLMRSVSFFFVPAMVLLLAVLLVRQVHRRILAPFLARRRPPVVLRIARLLSWSWLPLAVPAVYLSSVRSWSYPLPAGLTAAILLAEYGRWMVRSRTGEDPWTRGTRILVGALLAIAVFWSADRLSRGAGRMFGEDLAERPAQLPAIVLYSDKDLSLDAPGVVVTQLRGPRAEYRYRYAGLFLLERSDNWYFLLSDRPSRVIILNGTADVRMEFVAPRRSDVTP
ncbi:hypothetical protein [Actinoplanes sp. L3-i22]|uniref:hypothetical protein n=1 Tax=Actinoplanes sp. L3-i22 TaxID=2836373 RepID=UPI001C84C660|nr:hypothetical protein [Actinoplanes sp. L3-i22]